MAKYTPGAAVASVSGSTGGTTFSRNRYGQYMRRRAVPVQPNTTYQEDQRGILAAISQAYRGLSDSERIAWRTYAQNVPFTDRLGQTQILTAHAMFVQLNSRIIRMGGSPITSPPLAEPPSALETLSLSSALSTNTVELTFAETPLQAGTHLIVWAALVSSAGIRFVNNLLKQVMISSAAAASPVNIYSALVQRFGTLQVGQYLHVRVAVGDDATGLYSAPRSGSVVLA